MDTRASTLDIDLMIVIDQRDESARIMKSEGFTNVGSIRT